MRRFLTVLVLMVFCQLCMAADIDSLVTIRGKVVDASGAYLPYVKIKVEGDKMFKDSLALTDGNGEFDFNIKKTQDSCRVTFSYLGFFNKTYIIIASQTRDLGEVSMKEDAKMLDEVVVKGQVVAHEKDHVIYFPTQGQRKASNNGSRLLYNMMIPELTVDRLSGNALTKNGKAVTQCINGIPASITEIKSLRSKDIIRVDFYSTPSGRFSQYQAVVDFVVRTYESGGYATFNTSTTFLTPSGDYDFSSKYHTKRWNFNLYGGTGFIKDTKQHSKTEENIELEPEFQRTSETAYYYKKNESAYGAFRANYSHKALYFSILAGFKWNRMPKSINVNDVSYSTMQYSGLRDSTYSNNRSSSPYMKFFLRLQMSDKDYLVIDGGCGYAKNINNRTYNETDYLQPIVTNTDENNYYVNGNLYYWHTYKDNSYISTGVTCSDSRYKDIYSGTTSSNQTSWAQNNTLWIKYRKFLTENWYVFASVSLFNANTTINKNTVHEWKWMPNVTSEYTLTKSSKLNFNCSMSCLSPSQASKTPIRQSVKAYEVLQGNVDLRNYYEIEGQLAYTKYWENINIFANIAESFYTNSIQDIYFRENNMLIHTFQRGGTYSFSGANLWATTFLFDKTLQINAGGCYQIVHSNDIYRKNLNSFFWSIHMLYILGNLSFSANYDAGGYGCGPATSTYVKALSSYNFGASYNLGNLYVSLTATNIFNQHPKKYSYLLSPIYHKTSKNEVRTDMPSINLSLTYTLDFGHKKQKKEDVELDNKIDNGILKVE